DGGGGGRPGKRARSKARQKFRDTAAKIERALVARGARLLSIDRGEQFLHAARGWGAERLIEVDRLGKLLADQIVAAWQLAVACKRAFDAVGIAPVQCPCRMPRQQSLDLMAFRLFDRVHGQPLS